MCYKNINLWITFFFENFLWITRKWSPFLYIVEE